MGRRRLVRMCDLVWHSFSPSQRPWHPPADTSNSQSLFQSWEQCLVVVSFLSAYLFAVFSSLSLSLRSLVSFSHSCQHSPSISYCLLWLLLSEILHSDRPAGRFLELYCTRFQFSIIQLCNDLLWLSHAYNLPRVLLTCSLDRVFPHENSSLHFSQNSLTSYHHQLSQLTLSLQYLARVSEQETNITSDDFSQLNLCGSDTVILFLR